MRRRTRCHGIGPCLALLVSGWAGVGPAGAGADPLPRAPRLLVVPFESDASQARTYWLGEGVSVVVTDSLSALGGMTFTRAQRVQAFEQLHLPPAARLSRATLIRAGSLMGAGEVVFGQVTMDDATLTVRVRSLKLDEGRLRAEVVEKGLVTDLFAIGDRVARGMLREMGVALPPDGGAAPPAVVPLEAFEALVKGWLATEPESKAVLFRAAVERHPGYDRALLALWELDTDLGDHGSALRSARQVPDHAPLARRARFAAARSLIELARYDEAFATLSALASERADVSVLNNLGVVQLRRGGAAQTGLPTHYFTRAADADPDDPDLLFNLGYAYALDRNAQAAIYWLREALRRNAADGDAHYVLGAALHAAGATPEAIRERDLARRLSSKYAEWERAAPSGEAVPRRLERIADALDPVHTGRVDRDAPAAARSDARELTAFYTDRARRLAEAGKDGDAIDDLRRALFLAPYDAGALLLLARLHLRAGRAPEAADTARVAVWSEETAAGRVVLGQALIEAGDVAGARAEAERALVLDPESAEARALLASAAGAGAR